MAKRPVQQKYEMKIEEPIYVPMRDGVRIALRIYRPDAEGEFPALFAASPRSPRWWRPGGSFRDR